MDEVVCQIMHLSDQQIGQAAFAVMKRYSELFPEEEIVFLSMPKNDPAERRRILERVLELENGKK